MPARRALDHEDHRRELDRNRYVYAVLSRRAGGLSIGVNLNPGRDCAFSCRYCQVQRERPGRPERVDRGRLAAELDDLLGRLASGALWDQPPFSALGPEQRHAADIAIAGDGEPSASPDLPAALWLIEAARARHGLRQVPIRLLSNGSGLGDPAGQLALARLHALGGALWFKLDAGDEAAYRRINRGSVPFPRILAALHEAARQRPVVIQSLFARLDGQGPDEAWIAAWLDRLRALREAGGAIAEVQVTTLARAPADPGCSALGALALDAIAARVAALGLRASVHPGRWGRRQVLISAGATRNPLDSMRSVSAHSSGATGVALARALQRDHAVHLLASPEAALRAELAGVESVEVFGSTRDLLERVERWVQVHPAGAVVHAAAVGDYEAEAEAGKVESGRATWEPRLHPTPRILDRIRGWAAPGLVLVSFKAAAPGTGDGELVGIARRQLVRSGSDLVFANVIGRLGRGIALVEATRERWFDERDAAIAALSAHPLLDG